MNLKKLTTGQLRRVARKIGFQNIQSHEKKDLVALLTIPLRYQMDTYFNSHDLLKAKIKNLDQVIEQKLSLYNFVRKVYLEEKEKQEKTLGDLAFLDTLRMTLDENEFLDELAEQITTDKLTILTGWETETDLQNILTERRQFLKIIENETADIQQHLQRIDYETENVVDLYLQTIDNFEL